MQLFDCGRKIWASKGEEQEEGKTEVIGILKQLEEVIGEKAYFGGECLGFVDIVLIGYYTWFYAYETIGNFSIESECPKIMSWAKRCLQNESVSESLPDPKKVCDFVLQMKKKYGLWLNPNCWSYPLEAFICSVLYMFASVRMLKRALFAHTLMFAFWTLSMQLVII